MSQYIGQAKAKGFIFVQSEDGLRDLHTSFPIEREILDRMEANSGPGPRD